MNEPKEWLDDIAFGGWLRDVPYYIEKVSGDTVQRTYIISDGDPYYNNAARQLPQGCSEFLSFTRVTSIEDYLKAQLRKIYVNGRRFYEYMFKLHTKKDVILALPLTEKYIYRDNTYHDIFYLICGRLKGLDRDQILRHDGDCTPIGSKIASSLVKVAATRIFNEPEQAIIELVVNSIDSYGVQKGFPKTGKFGMGFFSIMYFLVGNPDRFIMINTIVDGGKNGTHILSSLRIQEIEGTLRFRINILPIQPATTGTVFTLHAPSESLNGRKLLDYFSYLTLVNTAIIRLDTRIGTPNSIWNVSGLFGIGNAVGKTDEALIPELTKKGINDWINVKITDNIITIEDYGTGIRPETIFGSLLIPSISTKGMKVSESKSEYENYSTAHLNSARSGFFSIAINRIRLFFLPFNPTGYTNKYTCILSLPPDVMLPVTRDDIIINKDIEKELEISLYRLVDVFIKEENIHQLSLAIDAYVTYTSNIYNKAFMEKFKDEMYTYARLQGYVLVKGQDYRILSSVIDKCIISDRVDYQQIEDILDKKNLTYYEDIFVAKRVVLLASEHKLANKTSTAGTYKYLFVNYATHSQPDWKSSLLVTFLEEKLYTVNPVLKPHELQLIGDKARHLPDSFEGDTARIELYYRKLLSLYTKMEILDDRLINQAHSVIWLIIQVIPDMLNKYIDLTISVCNKLPPNTEYGSGLKKLVPTIDFDYIKSKGFYGTSRYERVKSYLRSYIEEVMKSYYPFNNLSRMAAILPFTDKTIKFPSKPELFDLSLTFYELMFLNHSYIRIGGQGYVDGVPEKLFKNHAAVTRIVYNKYLKKIERPEHLSTYFIMPIPLVYAHNELEEYIKGTMSDIVPEISQIKVNFDFQSQFSNKQLISYIFKKNTLNFVTDIPSISREKPHEELQIIEIAVDAGTSKGFIEATLTELIQNSMDAIRITEAKNRSVSITTGTIVDFDDYCFCSIQDYVGMDMTNLQAISIPFYSNKTASEIATGEMGTGFFNVYRESVMVIIDTVKDGHRILVEDRPVRKNGRIQDIDKRVTESKTNDPNGTKITFVVKRDSHADVMSFLSVTSYLVHSVFAYMNFSDVILNGTSVKKSKRLIYRLDELECYRTDQGTKSYIFTKGVPFSVLFEYFQPILADLGISREQLEFMDTNLIINIRHGFYTPVQSRTKLNISPMNLAKLKTFLKNCLFYALLEYLYTASVYYDNIPNVVKQVQEHELLLDEKTRERTQRLHQLTALGDTATSEQRASYQQLWNEVVSIRKHKDKLVEQSLPVRVAYPVIENMTQLNLFNKVEIDQVIPKLAPGYVPGDSLTDILFYTQTLFKVPTTDNGRMVDHLHSFCGSSWIRDKQLYPEWKIEYRKYVERILKDVPDLDTRIIGDKFFKIIETWISTKAPPSDGKLEVKVRSGYDESKIINLVQPATIIFQKFVDTFLNLANEYGLDEYPKKLNVRFQLDQPGTLAYFSKNEIVVNTYNVNPLHLAIFIQNVPKYKQSIELVRDNLLYRSYFGVSYPASTIPHELEHARRNQKHDQGGVHDDVEVAILGKEKKRYNYDEATNEFLLFLSSKGFVEKFIAAL